MSLQVWLPLNGNLNNQGLDNITFSQNTGSTINNNGKIGQCYSFDATDDWIQYSIDKTKYANKPISYTYWFKCDQTKSGGSILDLAADLVAAYTYSSSGIKFTYWRCYSNSGTRTGDSGTTSTFYDASKWHHIAVIFNANINQIYVDGILALNDDKSNKYTTYWTPLLGSSYNRFSIGKSAGDSNWIGGMIQDVRIYDHALSSKEVEEISKALVLHYKLDENLNILNNCYSYPTFNTSTSSGGWSHWGPSGHAGTYSQNTDKKYIFNKTNTYSHCVDNTASDTGKYYLCYQSPAFDGGYRSLQCIVKEANGLPITESICYPGWNARNGGAPANKWTRIIPLGDGFYWCQVDGLSQDGSNDLVSITTQPGYKIYISEGYLENNKEICSNIFNQSNLTNVYDCSGYGNNGTQNNITSIVDTIRYNYAYQFNGTDSYIKVINNSIMSQGAREMTISLWAKASSWPTNGGRLFSCTETGGFNSEGGNSGYWRFPVHVYTNEGQTSTAYKYDGNEIQISALPTDEWVMLTWVYDTTGTRTYINGELHHTYTNTSYGIHFNTNARLFLGCEANTANPYTPYFNGQMSDFRMYYTALSAKQIKELYNTSVTIDKSGNVYARKLVEE